MSSESPEQRFARLVIAAFENQALTTDELVKRAGGPSNTYMTGLRKAAEGHADMKEPRSDTYRRIERAANWRRDTARLVWRGSEPEPLPVYEPIQPWQKKEELPRSRRFSSGIDGYVERIADRLLDLEERVDYLEQQLQERGGGASGNAAANQVPAPSPGDQLGTDDQAVVIVRDAQIPGQDPVEPPRRRGRGARD